MHLIERLKNMIRWTPQYQRIFVPVKQAGVVVTQDTASSYSPLHACVRINSEQMAAFPWQIFARAQSGRQPMPNHPVQWLLNNQANPEMSAFVFKRTMFAHMLTWGNGIAEIERNGAGGAAALWPLLPDRSWIRRSETGALVVQVSTPEGLLVIPRENVFILSDGSFDGIVGLSRVELARRAIGAGMAQDVMAASHYANGAHIGGVITNKGKTLSPDAKDVLLDSFNDKFAGPDRAAKTVYLDGGMEYTSGSLPLRDMQWLESRRFGVEEIARWYGTPLHLLNDLLNANYAISYEATKNFVEFTLRPMAILAEQEANTRLIGSRMQGSVYSRMNLNGLMRADPKTRGEYYRSMVNAGVMSINEVRELEELNSIGPDGDEHYMQINMTTLEHIADGDNMTAATPAADQTAPAAAGPEPQSEPAPTNVIRREAMEWRRRQQQEQSNG